MKNIGYLALLTALLNGPALWAKNLEIVSLTQNKTTSSQCSESEHLKMTRIKSSLIEWEKSSSYLKKQFSNGPVFHSHLQSLNRLERKGQKILDDLERLIHHTSCFTEIKQLKILLTHYSEKTNWIKEQRENHSSVNQQNLSLCQIQLKNTSQIFENAIHSLERNNKNQAYIELGETTFEIDRVLNNDQDCLLGERNKLKEIRALALSTLDQLR